jgi:GNAT superfamily N-acetyltransferase
MVGLLGVVVRRAGPGDIDQLVDLCAGLFAEDGGRRDVAIDVDWPRRHGAGYFSSLLDDGQALGIVSRRGRRAGRVPGRADAPARRDAAHPAGRAGGDVRHPAHRRRGIGAALVDVFRSWAGRQMAVRLSVMAYVTNSDAIRFYESEGFAPRSVSLEAPARPTDC